MNRFFKVFMGSVLLFIATAGFALAQFDLQEDTLFKADDTLEEIRDKIDYHGYQFTVDHNWVFDLSQEEKAQLLSRRHPQLLQEQETDLGPLAQHLGRTLPTSFDWRNVGGHSYIGPVRNQGGCGSCYSFGANAAAEGTYNYANGLTDGNCVDFSESFIIWCLGRLSSYNSHFFGCGGADYTYSELGALCAEGVTYESYFPYQENDPGSCTHWSDPTVSFESWHRVPCNDIDAIKTAIMTYGVVDAAVYVDSAFEAYDDGIYTNTSTTCSSSPCYNTPTNHAISLVGWNDNGGNGYWILRNSWGTSWGESGYMRISYTSARVACEVCYLVYGGTPPTATPSGPTPTPAPVPDILVVDDDNNASYESYYTTALANLDEDYDIVTSAPTLSQMNLYDIVIWFTGSDYNATLTSTDTANIQAYLNNGGKLFLTGQDIGYDINGDGTFYSTYLHASYVTDDTNEYALTGANFLAGTSVNISGTGGANNQGYPSAINPANGGVSCFSYSTAGNAGVCYSGTYKVVYFSFGFEAINSSVDRDDVMDAVLTYLRGGSIPTNTPVPPTNTPTRTPTPVPPTNTPTNTPIPPTNTPTRTPTPIPPTNTPVPPTNTPTRTPTPVPPTNTPAGSYILLVDDDGASYESYYETALTSLSKTYQKVTGSPSLSQMNAATAVIWFTGDDYTTTLTSTDQANIASYLNGGGKLFITGQDIGYNVRNSGTFMNDTLHATYVTDDTNYYTVNGAGVLSGLTLTISGTGGANNQNYPSAISAANGSAVCMNYANSAGAAGISYSGTGKLVYFSFGFEAINNASSRATVLDRVLQFLYGSTSPTNTPVPATNTPTFTPVPPTNTPTPASSRSILIVDDDKGKTYQTYYSAALPAGYTYTITTTAPTASQMNSYNAVVWLCGDDYSTTLTATDVSNLTSYLNGGGKLFISGQDIGYDIRTDSFFGNYLRASYIKDDTNNYDLTGVSGTIMSGINVNISGTGGANNQSYPSGMNPANGSTGIFSYGGSGNGYAGVSYSGTYKLVYMSCGFEAINSSSARSNVMKAVMDFLFL